MSSRNVYLSAEERRRAVVLYESLQEAERLYAEGVRDASRIVAGMREILERAAPIGIEYISVVDYATLSPVREIAGAALVAVCARIGRTRLIDNAILR
jgi:pantothenate synthetase